MEAGSQGVGPMKAMLKSELAAAAGVTTDTFRSWLRSDADYLRAQGIGPNAKLLPRRSSATSAKNTI